MVTDAGGAAEFLFGDKAHAAVAGWLFKDEELVLSVIRDLEGVSTA